MARGHSAAHLTLQLRGILFWCTKAPLPVRSFFLHLATPLVAGWMSRKVCLLFSLPASLSILHFYHALKRCHSPHSFWRFPLSNFALT